MSEVFREHLGTIVLIALFLLIAFGGWCYEKGQQRERESRAEALKERDEWVEKAKAEKAKQDAINQSN